MRTYTNNIPLHRLLEYLTYDPETGVFLWRKNKGSAAKVGAVAGSVLAGPLGQSSPGHPGSANRERQDAERQPPGHEGGIAASKERPLSSAYRAERHQPGLLQDARRSGCSVRQSGARAVQGVCETLMADIHFLNMQSVNPKALLAAIAGEDDLDGVVVCVRRNRRWETTWSSGLGAGSLCMAAMVLNRNVTARIFDGHPEDIPYDDDPA